VARRLPGQHDLELTGHRTPRHPNPEPVVARLTRAAVEGQEVATCERLRFAA
jgi:hypothetical protein